MEVGGSNAGVTLMNCRSDRCLYQEGEKVLASYGGRWYEAKVQKVESTRTKGCLHFVHYLGWNKKWDEWLEAERLKKFTEEIVRNQSKECGESARARNRKISQTEKNMNIEIPPTLKKQLVDDFEFVTHLGQLVNLPRTPNVNDILNKYSAFRVKTNNGLNEEMEEFSRGLCGYFDKALPAMLLYDSKRTQYQALSEEHKPPSSVYGAEHLLRLFVKLPEILESVKIEEETLIKLQHEIIGLLKSPNIRRPRIENEDKAKTPAEWFSRRWAVPRLVYMINIGSNRLASRSSSGSYCAHSGARKHFKCKDQISCSTCRSPVFHQ